MSANDYLLSGASEKIYEINTKAAGPAGRLPLTEELLLNSPNRNLSGMKDLPSVLVPGGVTLPPAQGEDAGMIQTIGARYAHGLLSLQEAAELGCRACASPGGGCQFLGTAATSQVVGEAFGMSLPHSALAPSGQAVWSDLAVRAARAVVELQRRGLVLQHILTKASLRNAMAIHAAFGGS